MDRLQDSKYKSFNFFLNIAVLLFGIVSVVNLTPLLERQTPTFGHLIILLVWAFFIILSKPSIVIKPTLLTTITILWIGYLVITRILGIGDDAIGNLFYYISFWFMLVGLEFFCSLNNIAIQRKVVNWINIIMVINIIVNLIELYNNPVLSKYITGGVVSGVGTNVGNYSYSFMCGLFGLICFWRAFQKGTRKYKKCFFFLIAMLSFCVVCLASSMISIFAVLVGLFVYLFFHITKNRNFRKLLVMLFVISILCCILLFSETFYQLFSDLAKDISNPFIQRRALIVVDTLFGYTGFWESSRRMELYLDSIRTFANNPVFGMGMYHTDVKGMISLHSQILDDLAYFGLIGLLFHVAISLKFWQKHLSNKRFASLIYPYYIAVVFFLLFNPLITGTLSAGIMLFILVPLTIKVNDCPI